MNRHDISKSVIALSFCAGAVLGCMQPDGSSDPLDDSSSSLAAPSGGRPRYSAPALVNERVVHVPASGAAGTNCGPVARGGASEDLLLVFPNQPVDEYVEVVGFRHIRIIGGSLRPNSAAHGCKEKGYMLRFSDKPAGSIYIEGLEIDGSRYREADGINVIRATGSPTVYLQNSRIVNIHGGSLAPHQHADGFQVMTGSIGNLYVDKLTASSDYQGFLMAIAANETAMPGGTAWHFSRFNIVARTNAVDPSLLPSLFYFLQGTLHSPRRHVVLQDGVYARPLPGKRVPVDHVQPPLAKTPNVPNPTYADPRGMCADHQTYCAFPQASDGGRPGIDYYEHFVEGRIMYGDPPNGDWVRPGQAGVGYTSAGRN
jgi:hypothetical protein